MKKFKVNQKVLFCSAGFTVKKILDDGMVLESVSKNFDEITIREKDINFVYPNTDANIQRLKH